MDTEVKEVVEASTAEIDNAPDSVPIESPEETKTLENSPEDSEPANATICGWLTKQGGHGLIANWRKRWFVLDTRAKHLNYFKSQQDTEPAGSIDLSLFTHIEHHAACRKSKFCWALSARPVVKELISPPIPLDEPEQVVEMDAVQDGTVAPEPIPADEESPKTPAEAIVSPESTAKPPQRTYYAYAQNEEEMLYWMKAIGACLSTNDEDAEDQLAQLVPPPPHSLVEAPKPIEEKTIEEKTNSDEPATVEVTQMESTDAEVETATAEEDVVEVVESGHRDDSAIIKAEDEHNSLKRQSIISSSHGYKLATLPMKMAELDEKMRSLATLPKEELPVIHDLLRMAYALVQKEYQQLGSEMSFVKHRNSILSQTDEPSLPVVVEKEQQTTAESSAAPVAVDEAGR